MTLPHGQTRLRQSPWSAQPTSRTEIGAAEPKSRFLPSSKIFTKTEFDFTTIEHRLRGLAYLNIGVTVAL